MNPEDVFREEAAAFTSYFQYKGVWDMQDLYEFVASFFHRAKFKFYEQRYIQKSPGPFGPEVYHVWQAVRDVEENYQYQIDIFLHTFDTQDIEVVMKDGSKRTFTKGRLWIQFKGATKLDYEKNFDESNFYVHLKEFYHKYVVHKKIESVWWDQMYYSVYLKLQQLIKERLKMESESCEYKDYHSVRR
jgi:hypothetical protein|tara:strand:+ start:5267 stop:5830 length:564 start_codon:yes stop_codon:yes gene_type:complete